MNESSQSNQSHSHVIPLAIIIVGFIIGGAVIYSKNPQAGTASVRRAGQGTEDQRGRGSGDGTSVAGNDVTRVDVSVDDDPAMGEANAPITVIEFSDFQCPFCGRFHAEALPQIKKQYVDTGKVRLVYRDFPLSSLHPDAIRAAEAAQCAFEQKKFWEFHDLIFENQSALGADDLKKYASRVGLDQTQFASCLDGRKYKDEVQNDFADGQAAGVTGTPTFYINGQRVIGALPFSAFQTIIESELAGD